jgi:glycosyltransferase involved in cell wall biosynthesis
MKILLLGDGGSAHMQKWVLSMARKNVEIGLFSLHHFKEEVYREFPIITILNNPAAKNARSLFTKLNYLTNVGLLKKQIALYKPDILHAHYATSYGSLGAKTDFKPYVVSVWGSDVYDFPKTSPLHRKLVKRVLAKADIICSTSHCMKLETLKYTHSPIEIVAFGVDVNVFKPEEAETADKNKITFGIIKSLEKKYGIEFLIKAFAEVVKKHADKNLELKIVGDGSKRDEYEKLSADLNISSKVEFVGKVPHDEVIKYHKQIDVFVSLSTLDSESFGVSLVEAMACGKPVVASDVAGFTEVVGNDDCGILVPKNSYKEAAEAMSFYIENPEKATAKGKNARQRVLQFYDWNNNVEQMLSVYQKLL